VASRVIPVRFLLTDDHIGVVDRRTGELALRYDEALHLLRQESEARWRAEAAQERAEAVARQAAEAELVRLQAELVRLRRRDQEASEEG
jgi:hypothetical protein